MAGRKTRSTNEILVDILNELAEYTDSEHGLTVKELSNRVGGNRENGACSSAAIGGSASYGPDGSAFDCSRYASGGQCRCTPRMVHGACD